MNYLKRKWKSIVGILLGLMVATVAGFYIYTLDYYRALPAALDSLTNETITYKMEKDMIVFNPPSGQSDQGIIFYPGGKVEYLAYIPLMEQIAKEGYTCFLMKMPLNLAVLDQKAADRPIAEYKDISSWYISGHSLGGAMASVYTSNNLDKIDGLILLGAYPAADLSRSEIPMISIYGSEDNILSKDKAEENRSYAPEDSTYFEIQGGNHAYYGSYGEQKKDGLATLSDTEQQAITGEEIIKFIKLN